MKKLFAMFLAVMLVVSLAGVVMAEEMAVLGGGCPPDPCPDFLQKFDTLKVNYEVVPLTSIDILTRDVQLCSYIGCESGCGLPQTFNYKAIATGSTMRKIVGKIQSVLPAGLTLSAIVNRPDSSGTSEGWQPLTTSDVDLVKGISKMCWANGTGQVKLCASNEASAVTSSVVMQLTIMDQGV